MWDVSAEFLDAIRKPHRIETKCTYTVPGGDPVEFGIKAGSITVDGTSRTRRYGRLTVEGESADFVAMSTLGTVFTVEHGLRIRNTTHLVPVFTGEMKKGSQGYGGGTLTLPIVDLSVWLSRCEFVKPFSPAAATTRVAAITSIVLGARPSTTVLNLSSDEGTIGIKQMWANSRLDAITDLTRDGRIEAFFRPDGVFVIRDKPTILSPSVWNTAGTLKALERTRGADLMYNTVIVRRVHPKKQKWSQQTASITDLADPRHPDYIGVIPKFVDSPTARTAADALAIAQSTLDSLLGVPETLDMETLTNPALEAGDPIRVQAPQIGLASADTFQHFVDAFTLDLKSGAMSIATRSQVANV